MNRDPSLWHFPNNARALKLEVLFPSVTTWMKESDYLTVPWIDTRQVRSLAGVTTIASKSKILRIVGTTVLLSCDVFDVMREPAWLFVEKTVLTPNPCPLKYKLASGTVHHAAPLVAR